MATSEPHPDLKTKDPAGNRPQQGANDAQQNVRGEHGVEFCHKAIGPFSILLRALASRLFSGQQPEL